MEFDVLAQKLAEIDPENDENAEEKLKEIIDDYNELCNIVKEINEIFSLTLLANVFMSQGSLCTCVSFLFVSFLELQFLNLIYKAFFVLENLQLIASLCPVVSPIFEHLGNYNSYRLTFFCV
ncbi:hypothetical protein PVAND_000273 [Polypedilum vanderplanki]|uniref:Uncharacterized protein n=1 Tax=Polypedilum vanderplanki TaxID=319348 RepID=A0A9J6BJC9_POLVA|nr:hypothetical protein PVAND_000273 [Polypedilum vanderplanki]